MAKQLREKYQITDYTHKISLMYNQIMDSKEISQANKDALDKFLRAYKIKKGPKKGQSVSIARKALFLTHIQRILKATDDIKKDMFDQDKINEIFTGFEKMLSTGYYGTVVNITLRFVRWLNDGEKPSGFKDIENISKEGQKRNLQPEDEWEWEDALKHSRAAKRIQDRAWAPIRVEAGPRAAEFLGLNYGDVKKKLPYYILSVDGKTGARDIIIYRSVKFLQDWLDAHPTKRKDDPLWVMTKPAKDGKGRRYVRYTYPAHKKQFHTIAQWAGIDKPTDFNATRHSAARLSKIEGMNPLQAAENLGHSLEYYQKTYGKLSTADRIRAQDEHNGRMTDEEKKKARQTIVCPKCDRVNDPGSKTCEKCGSPLTLADALKLGEEAAELKKQMAQLIAQVADLQDIKDELRRRQAKT